MKIVIADDHAIVRHGLRQIIATRGGWTVVGEAASGDELLDLLRRVDVDVLVLDVSIGDRSGIDLLEPVRAIRANLPVLMLSMYAEEHYAIRAIRAGASGYIQKDRPPEEIVAAIERVAAGRKHMSAAVVDQMAATIAGSHHEHPHDDLSAREFQVFRLIADGKSITEIADLLHVSVKTVSTYRTRIVAKTGFRTNADIIAYAIRNGLL
ncbi:MAG TPA: response regulator transcription factor [Thermoanaerobaculia bacterium]|nr:response regulator transcription factor [Thermoanaerobaculia bacterium]